MKQNVFHLLSYYLKLLVLGQTSLHEDNQEALWRGSHNGELRPPAYSHRRKSSRKRILQPP